MAKVTGPLFSVDASGRYAGSLVFAKWKGRNYVRQLVIPSNPMSADQETARNSVRVTGAAQHFVAVNTQTSDELSDVDLAVLKGVTPAGYAWNGYLTQKMIGEAGANMTAADTAWGALAAADQTAWDTAAAGLTAPIPEVQQYDADGSLGTPKSGGEVLFDYYYGLYMIGLVSEPGATPPTYT